jgi:O-antigen ligase
MCHLPPARKTTNVLTLRDRSASIDDEAAPPPERAQAQPASSGRPVLKAALIALLVYGTYQNHFAIESGIKGLNLMTALFLIAIWCSRKAVMPPCPPAPAKGFLYVFFGGLVWSFLMGQFYDASPFMEDLTVVKNMLFAMLLYFVSYRASADARMRRTLMIALLLVIALVTVHVWRQAIDYGIGNYNESRRAAGPFGPDARAANRAAAFFIIFLPVMLSAAMYLRSQRLVRLFAMAFVALGVGGMFFTYSRQAYIVVALLFTYMAFRRNWLLSLVVVGFLLSYEAWAPQGVIERIQVTQQEDANGEKKLDESAESRFIIWAGAAEIIASHPLGIGLNRFQRTIGDYVPQFTGFDAHNNYIRFTTEGGIPGIATMVALLLALLALSRRTLKAADDEETRFIGTSFFVATLGVILSNLYGSRFFDTDIMGAYWILAGVGARHLVELKRASASLANDDALDLHRGRAP